MRTLYCYVLWGNPKLSSNARYVVLHAHTVEVFINCLRGRWALINVVEQEADYVEPRSSLVRVLPGTDLSFTNLI